MIKRFLSLALILAISLFAAPVPAQQKQDSTIQLTDIKLADEPAIIFGGNTLTIGDAIRYAIERNPTIISGAYDVAMTDSAAQAYKAKYGPMIMGDAGGANSRPTPGNQIFTGEEQSSFDGSVTLSKKFQSGTTISTGLQHNYTKREMNPMQLPVYSVVPPNNIIGVTPPLSFMMDEYHMPVYFVSVEQELLRNVVGYNERRTQKMLDIGANIQKDYILFALSQFVVGVISDYWYVVQQKTRLANADLQVLETKKVRDIIARNVKLGLLDDFNLNFYNARLAGAEAQKIGADRSYRDALRKFLTRIDFSSEADLPSTAVLSDKLPVLNTEEALKAAYQKRADYINAQRQIEISRLDLQIQKNEALPSLTAEFSASTMGQDPDAAQAYEDMAKFKYTNLEGKLKVSYLFDNRAQFVAERNARFKLKQAEIDLDKTRREVKDDVIGKIEQINAAHGMYLKMKDARREAELSYYRMVENIRWGRLLATIVKDGLDALLESRQRELDALVYYNVSLLMFDVSKNELYEKYNIDVNRYIPKDDRGKKDKK